MPTRRERIWLLLPLAVVLIPFLIWPSLFGFLASITNYAPGEIHPHFVALRNYLTAFSSIDFRASWQNVIVFTLTSVPLELAIGLGLAYLLREPFRGRALARVLLLVPWLVSPIANGVMWHFLLSLQVGLFNYGLAWLNIPAIVSPLASATFALPATIVTDIWRNAPFACFLLLPGLLAIPNDIWEWATIEGASTLDRFRFIVLPWLRPLILTIAMLLIGSAFGTFDSVLILTGGGPGSATMLPALFSYLQTFEYHLWPIGATSAWLIVACIVAIGLIYLRLFRSEVT